MSEPKTQVESQKQRRVKYGANVALVIVVAIAITFFVIAIAQRTSRQFDTTSQGIYSLKPQTINVIKDLGQKVRLISLYGSQSKPEARIDPEGRFSGEDWPNYVQTVADLLGEYKRNSRNIDVELIDPDVSPAKVDGLIAEVTERYGGEVKKYQEFIDAFPARFQQIKTLANSEAATIKSLPLEGIQNADAMDMLSLSFSTVDGFPELLDRNEQAVQKLLKQKPPDYKGATGRVEQSMDSLSTMLNLIISNFAKLKEQQGIPDAIRQYMAESTPRYEQMKKESDGLLEQIKQLGELKLDDLRQSLRQQNTILVLGEKDLKVVPFTKVWQIPADAAQYMTDVAMKPRFAGEQQITSAIVSLTQEKKQRVVFVRPDGAPLTSPGFPPFVEGGPMSQVATRLVDLNFEVLEKDLSGTYAMQAQMRGMPGEPDATDEQMRDALWVVLGYPSGQQRNPMMPPPQGDIAGKLQQHLDAGGSAVVILAPSPMGEGPDLGSVLASRGIQPRTNAIVVHELVADEQQQGDPLDQARRLPYVFDIKQYGDHLLTKPLRSLSSLMVPLLPVNTTEVAGYKVTPILPIPEGVKTWGETNIEGLGRGDPPNYAEGADVASPKYAGAVAESDKGQRLVAIGSPVFMFNRYLEIPEPSLARRGTYVARFPGNAELFVNSVLWAAGQDTLLAISPAAMEVSRLRDMSSGELMFARVLIVGGIPLAVLIAGVLVWMRRRD